MGVDRITGRASNIAAKISEYYVDNARALPWRIPTKQALAGQHPDPYHVWLSEVMLQQTTVAAVIVYFQKFTQRWPAVGDLARAPEADVLAAWAGLGYYARARNLHKCARYVTENRGGVFPHKESELLKLPGIGNYTAAAIAAIAFGERAVVVDANIERLVARLFAIDTPLPAGKSEIKEAMDVLTPPSNPGNFAAGNFAQACMDLGATICTAKKPKCLSCPVTDHCAALKTGDVERFPVKPPKKAKPARRGRFYWIERDSEILLVQRADKGMLAGMRALPDDRWAAGNDGDKMPPFPDILHGKWEVYENIVQHGFTHFSLVVDLAVYQDEKIVIKTVDDNIGNKPNSSGLDEAVWWPVNRIEDAGLPTLFAKAVRWKLSGNQRNKNDNQH